MGMKAASSVALRRMSSMASTSARGEDKLSPGRSMCRSKTDGALDDKASTVPAERWRSNSNTFEFEDAVSAFSVANESSGAGVKRVSCVSRLGATVQQALGLHDDEESPTRKSMKHACRGLVERISLDAQAIPAVEKFEQALGLHEEEESPTRKSMKHACRGLVQRISLDAHL